MICPDTDKKYKKNRIKIVSYHVFVRAVAVSKTVVCAIKRTSLSLIMLSPWLVSAHSDGRGLAVSE